jgi:hypothetical protein
MAALFEVDHDEDTGKECVLHGEDAMAEVSSAGASASAARVGSAEGRRVSRERIGQGTNVRADPSPGARRGAGPLRHIQCTSSSHSLSDLSE